MLSVVICNSSFINYCSIIKKYMFLYILLIGDLQQTRYVEPMSFYCWASVADNGPTLKQHWLNVSCLLGHNINIITHDIFCFFPADKIH